MVPAGVVEGRPALDSKVILPRQPARYGPAGGGPRARHNRHEVEGLGHALRGEEAGQQHVGVRQVELLAAGVLDGCSAKCPPFSSSRIEQKTLGESKAGRHSQSMVPSLPTSAAVCRFPMTRDPRWADTPLQPPFSSSTSLPVSYSASRAMSISARALSGASQHVT